MTTLLSRTPLVPAAASFAAMLAILIAVMGAGRDPGASVTAHRLAATPDAPRPGATTDQRIATLQATVRAQPTRADGYTLLAGAYRQKVRETGDAAYYAKADGVVARALRLAPGDAAALTERAALEASRHDFRGALRDALAARRAAPEVDKPFGVLVDALVELGRYREAGAALQEMVDRKPDLAAYARVSYLRELHGDLRGAAAAMRLAVSAGSGTAENAAFVQALLGDLHFGRGRLGGAALAYRRALALVPRYAPADAGLARVHAARGDLAGAIRRLSGVVARLPLPQYVVALGETELAAGRRAAALGETELAARRRAAARRDLAVVRAEQRLLASSGVNTDVEVALFEADHGSPARAVALARRAWHSAPSVRSADAVGWALTRAGHPRAGLVWAHRALRLHSRDATVLYRAGMTARAAGDRALARTWLRRALAANPRFSPLYAPRAARALRALGR
jgi:tetratricopeptide (TPR) repeat protein